MNAHKDNHQPQSVGVEAFKKVNEALNAAKVPSENRQVMDENDPRVFNPLATPATIDIEEVAKKILVLGLHKYGGYEKDSLDCVAKATTLIAALITEKENRARVSELKQLEPPEQYEEYAKLMGSEHCNICGFNALEFCRHIQDRIKELRG